MRDWWWQGRLLALSVPPSYCCWESCSWERCCSDPDPDLASATSLLTIPGDPSSARPPPTPSPVVSPEKLPSPRAAPDVPPSPTVSPEKLPSPRAAPDAPLFPVAFLHVPLSCCAAGDAPLSPPLPSNPSPPTLCTGTPLNRGGGGLYRLATRAAAVVPHLGSGIERSGFRIWGLGFRV